MNPSVHIGDTAQVVDVVKNFEDQLKIFVYNLVASLLHTYIDNRIHSL